jgi:hypothetical protein
MRTTMGTTKARQTDQDTRVNDTRAYTPAPEAPRSARRVAMRVRREQERRLAGW